MIRKRKRALVHCNNCIYWARVKKGKELQKDGDCHQKPPTVLDNEGFVSSWWPRTEETDFCSKGFRRVNRTKTEDSKGEV